MAKSIVITGITGQMGSYASMIARSKDWETHGIIRTTTRNLPSYLDDKSIVYHSGDLADLTSLCTILSEIKPDYLLHYAAQSQVGTSFNQPHLTFSTNASGSLNLLEALRTCSPHTKCVFLATSEMFGNNYSYEKGLAHYQNEQTAFEPVSVYGAAKLAMYWMVRKYRDSYDLPVCSAIQFNSEGRRRGSYFVTRKITEWLGRFNWFALGSNYVYRTDYDAEICSSSGSFPKLALGNIDGVYRDWSDARDSVRAHFLMLEKGDNKEYCVGSGKAHSLKEFIDLAFQYAEIDNPTDHIYQDPQFMRANDLYYLCSDPSLIQQDLSWEPHISFNTLVQDMVHHDLDLFSKGPKYEKQEIF